MHPLRLRDARDDDYDALDRLFPELETGEPTPPKTRWVEGMRVDTRLAERDGTVVGLCLAQRLDDTGYVRLLITDPTVRRMGVGRALMRDFADRCRAAGLTRWCLNVRPDNGPAIALYESMGMARDHRATAVQLPWEVVRAGDAARVRAFTLDEAPAVERAFDWLAGQCARLAKHGATLVCVDAPEGGYAGAAVFDANVPGAMPFRARDVDTAWAMLTVMRTHAKAGDATARIVVRHDDVGVREALLDAGGVPVLEVLHLRGAVPSER